LEKLLSESEKRSRYKIAASLFNIYENNEIAMKFKPHKYTYFKGYKKLKNVKMFEEFTINERQWKFTIDLSDIWSDELEFSPELAKKIYDRIMEKFEEIQKAVGDDAASELSNLAEYVRDSSDDEEFDSTMTDLYDWADAESVWVKTSV